MSTARAFTAIRQPFVISSADEAMLRAVHRLYFVTSLQVCRLLYSPGSHTYVQTKMKQLADAGLLLRLFLPRPSASGSGPRVYTLAREGLNFLKAQGVEISPRYRPAEHRFHSYLHLSHTLAVNDVLISLELLCRQMPRLRLHQMLHERTLKRQPLQVQDGESTIAVIPDAWVDLRDNLIRICVALEIDRGTLDQKQWRRKIRGLVKSFDGAYQERFQARSLLVAIVATPGASRLAELRRWTESALTELGAGEQAALFRLTDVDPTSVSPEQFFCAPIWQRPFEVPKRPLLSLSPGRGGMAR